MNDEERSLVQRARRPRPLVLVAIAILASNAPLATADGSSVYAEQCASCHGPDGRADTPVGRALGIRSFEGRSFTLDGVEKLLRESQSHARVDRAALDGVLPELVETLNGLAGASE